MDREKIKDILDKSKISVVDEINILEYINELIQIKMEYFKSLDKLDAYENRIDKAIEYIEKHIKYECDDAFNGMQFYSHHLYDFNKEELLDILRGEDNE